MLLTVVEPNESLRDTYLKKIGKTLEDIQPKEDEQFWDIIEIDNYILFQSLDRIYIYGVDTNDFKIIDSSQRINKIFNF